MRHKRHENTTTNQSISPLGLLYIRQDRYVQCDCIAFLQTNRKKPLHVYRHKNGEEKESKPTSKKALRLQCLFSLCLHSSFPLMLTLRLSSVWFRCVCTVQAFPFPYTPLLDFACCLSSLHPLCPLQPSVCRLLSPACFCD